jgi:RimJ/RimL family protein N-acetyltransferase
MTNQDLEDIINDLNTNNTPFVCKCRTLTKQVDFIEIWDGVYDKSEINNQASPDTYYAIRDKSGSYIGIVLASKADLHWFIMPESRRKGHLMTAMKKTIIKQLFKTRDSQRITISKNIEPENFKASQSVAIKLGFVEIDYYEGVCIYELKKQDIFPQ